jgi:hypothetical protein
VTIAASLLGVMSVFGLLGIGLAFASTFLMPNPALRQAPGGLAIAAIGDLILAGLLAFGLWTAIGLFRLRRWARYSVIVIGILIFLMWSGMAALMFVLPHFLPVAVKANLPAQEAGLISKVFVGIAIFELAIGLVGLWWAIYFNFKRVRLAFAAARGVLLPTAAPSMGEPLATTGAAPPAGQKSFWQVVTVVLAWLMLFGGVMILAFAWIRLPFFFLGITLRGNGSLAGMLVLAAIQIFAGAGLLRKLPSAYWTAVASQVIGILNAVSLLIPSIAARATEVSNEFSRLWIPQPPDSFINSTQLASFQRYSIMAGGVFSVLILLFFLYAFYRCRSWYLGDSRTAVDGFAD